MFPEEFYWCEDHGIFFPRGQYCPGCGVAPVPPQPPASKDTRDGDYAGIAGGILALGWIAFLCVLYYFTRPWFS